MASLASRTLGRKAYGAHRAMSPAVKARNVAQSIRTREQEGRPWSFADYGLEGNASQIRLVLEVLTPYTQEPRR